MIAVARVLRLSWVVFGVRLCLHGVRSVAASPCRSSGLRRPRADQDEAAHPAEARARQPRAVRARHGQPPAPARAPRTEGQVGSDDACAVRNGTSARADRGKGLLSNSLRRTCAGLQVACSCTELQLVPAVPQLVLRLHSPQQSTSAAATSRCAE